MCGIHLERNIYSFCGPSTKLNQRLNPDGTAKDWSQPINKVDGICMNHDKAYEAADQGIGTRHEADKTMLNELKDLDNKELSWNDHAPFREYFSSAGWDVLW